MTALSHYVVGISIFFSLRGAGLQVKTETISQAFFLGKMKTDTAKSDRFHEKNSVQGRFTACKHEILLSQVSQLWVEKNRGVVKQQLPSKRGIGLSEKSNCQAKQQKQEKEAEIQRRLPRLRHFSCFQWFLFFSLYTFSRIEGELPALESQLSELRQKKAICCPWLQMTHVQ